MKIALLGYGTVAKGTADALKYTDIEIGKVLVRREIPALGEKAVRSIDEIVSDPSIDLVAEVMGGEEPALTYVLKALNAGKHVVSANKLMFSLHYDELLAAARKNHVSIAFSATAGGGIPWLINLQRMKRVGEITSLGGIMNGTCNFILDSMQTENDEFEDALVVAQQLGYAEADPTADIDGLDVRAKLALSCNAAWNCTIDPASIPALGIRYINREDIEAFRSVGLIVRLIGRAEMTKDGPAAYVEPMLFTAGAPEAGIGGAGNIISAESSTAGRMSFIGGGAGRGCTGAAVAGDICDIASGISIFDGTFSEKKLSSAADQVGRKYYFRCGEEVKIERCTVKEMNDKVKEAAGRGLSAFAASFEQDDYE